MNRDDKRLIREKCGAQRKANARKIRAALVLNGHSGASIARTEGISAQAVNNVIMGNKHTARILDALETAGVPAELLADPRKVMQHAS